MATYPRTRRDEIVESLHGHAVADPYRWLEDADSPEVVEWVTQQRTLTEHELAQYPERAWFHQEMLKIVGRPRHGMPVRKGGRWFVARNPGTLAQDRWYTALTLDALLAGGQLLLDPNTWSGDGTTSLRGLEVSGDGRYLVYDVSEGGSDWQRLRLLDLELGTELPDEVVAKFSVPAWLPDHRSFLYCTYDQAEDARGTATDGLGAVKVRRHRVGVAQDELVLALDDPRLFAEVSVTRDGRWLVVSTASGTDARCTLEVRPLETEEETVLGAPIVLFEQADAERQVIRSLGDSLVVLTDQDAPRRKVVRVGITASGAADVTDLLAEGEWPLEQVVPIGERYLVTSLEDATSRCRLVDGQGREVAGLELPAGTVVGTDGAEDTETGIVAVSTLESPLSAFAVDEVGSVRELALTEQAETVTPAHQVIRRRAVSVDGTQVPYFFIVPDDGQTGPRPTILYGYGGFAIPEGIRHIPGWPAWLRAGGAVAIANLRGGGEFGTQWHEDGRLERKQNVFDDAIACAEDLVDAGLTTPGQLAVHGRSNGGLLVGAVMTQRPDLFRVALPTVGVLDMVRFHQFTIGAAWIADYGDPDDAAGLETVLAYSPLHQVTDGTSYPATLVSTADHDDRVVPLHSYKFAAALQHAQGGEAPVLLRVESSAGHGAGKSAPMVAAEWGDLLAFTGHHTGLEVPEV